MPIDLKSRIEPKDIKNAIFFITDHRRHPEASEREEGNVVRYMGGDRPADRVSVDFLAS